jgi:hypothetical protein
MMMGMVLTLLKVLALRSFRNSQVMSMRREAMDFLQLSWAKVMVDHQSSTSS